jgi:hypothetical protein
MEADAAAAKERAEHNAREQARIDAARARFVQACSTTSPSLLTRWRRLAERPGAVVRSVVSVVRRAPAAPAPPALSPQAAAGPRRVFAHALQQAVGTGEGKSVPESAPATQVDTAAAAAAAAPAPRRFRLKRPSMPEPAVDDGKRREVDDV